MPSQIPATLQKQIKKLPKSPGVYFFLGRPSRSGGLGSGRPAKIPRKSASSPRESAILYIGKATSLQDRVRSYFNGDLAESRGPLVVSMLPKITSIKHEKTDSVLEALILEANLIKKHQPKHNTNEKSDRSFLYVVITDEDFPRVLTMREREVLTGKTRLPMKVKTTFGPYLSSTMLREALKIIRKIFPYFDTNSPVKKLANQRQNRLSFNRQLGLYPPADITKKEYARTIRNITLFLQGKKKQLIKKLEQEMKAAAKAREFEQAQELKRTIFALQHIQDISLLKEESRHAGRTLRFEAYDIAHLAGTSPVGVMVVVEDGEAKPRDYRTFNIRGAKGNSDTDNLREILERRLNHPEWSLPQVIVIDGGKAQLRVARSVLTQNNESIKLVAVTKDEHHRAREIIGDKETAQKFEKEILLANSEAHRFAINFHQKKRLQNFRNSV